MNRKIFMVLITFISTVMVNAKPGCLSNTYDLKEKFDPKEYHDVLCYCPCDSWAMRGLRTDRQSRCLECGHAHNPGPNPYIGSKKTASNKQPMKYPGLEKMIIDHKSKK